MALNGEYSLGQILDILRNVFGYSGGVAPTNAGVREAPLSPIGAHQSLTVDNTVKTLAAPGTGTKRVIMQSLGADTRYTLDGTNPSSTVGFMLGDGVVPVVLDYVPGMTIKVTRDASVSATLQYQYAN